MRDESDLQQVCASVAYLDTSLQVSGQSSKKVKLYYCYQLQYDIQTILICWRCGKSQEVASVVGIGKEKSEEGCLASNPLRVLIVLNKARIPLKLYWRGLHNVTQDSLHA